MFVSSTCAARVGFLDYDFPYSERRSNQPSTDLLLCSCFLPHTCCLQALVAKQRSCIELATDCVFSPVPSFFPHSPAPNRKSALQTAVHGPQECVRERERRERSVGPSTMKNYERPEEFFGTDQLTVCYRCDLISDQHLPVRFDGKCLIRS